MFILTLIIAGAVVGFLSTFFGVGGGAIIVPVLYGIFPDAPPAVVIGTSLSAIFFNSILNSYNFKRLNLKPRLDWGILLAVGMAIGVICSSHLIQGIEPRVVRLFFAGVLIVIALKTLLYNPKGPVSNNALEGKIKLPKAIKIILTGIIGGTIAGITGLGGGTVVVPILLIFHKFSLASVPIYSNLAMIGGCLVGMIRYTQITSLKVVPEGFMALMQVGSVQFVAVVCIFVGTIFTNRLGARFAQKVAKKTGKRLFVIFLFTMSGKILYSIYF